MLYDADAAGNATPAATIIAGLHAYELNPPAGLQGTGATPTLYAAADDGTSNYERLSLPAPQVRHAVICVFTYRLFYFCYRVCVCVVVSSAHADRRYIMVTDVQK